VADSTPLYPGQGREGRGRSLLYRGAGHWGEGRGGPGSGQQGRHRAALGSPRTLDCSPATDTVSCFFNLAHGPLGGRCRRGRGRSRGCFSSRLCRSSGHIHRRHLWLSRIRGRRGRGQRGSRWRVVTGGATDGRLADRGSGAAGGAAIRKNVRRHARVRLLLPCPYSTPLVLRLGSLPGPSSAPLGLAGETVGAERRSPQGRGGWDWPGRPPQLVWQRWIFGAAYRHRQHPRFDRRLPPRRTSPMLRFSMNLGLSVGNSVGNEKRGARLLT
jgi:hypothetical protein